MLLRRFDFPDAAFQTAFFPCRRNRNHLQAGVSDDNRVICAVPHGLQHGAPLCRDESGRRHSQHAGAGVQLLERPRPLPDDVVGNDIEIFFGDAHAAQLHPGGNHDIRLACADFMGQQRILRKQDARHRVLLVIVQLNVRIRAGQRQKASVKRPRPAAGVPLAVNFFQLRPPLVVLKDPFPEGQQNVALFVRRFHRVVAVQRARFMRPVRRRIVRVIDADRAHIHRLFDDIHGVDPNCPVGADGADVVCIGGRIRNHPLFGDFVVGGAVVAHTPSVIAQQMLDERINEPRRNPWRPQRRINLSGRDVRRQNRFQRRNIFGEKAVIAFVGGNRRSVFRHQVAGEIFVRRFKPAVKALAPCLRVPVNRPAQRLDTGRNRLSARMRNEFQIHMPQLRQGEDQRVARRIRPASGILCVAVKRVFKVERQVHARHFVDVRLFFRRFAIRLCFCRRFCLFLFFSPLGFFLLLFFVFLFFSD